MSEVCPSRRLGRLVRKSQMVSWVRAWDRAWVRVHIHPECRVVFHLRWDPDHSVQGEQEQEVVLRPLLLLLPLLRAAKLDVQAGRVWIPVHLECLCRRRRRRPRPRPRPRGI